ncbi:MAG: homoserine dehydrogenase [Ilumatobacteraceae bacterium]|jgi:homoserine dehydrogenase|nr:homoserine dehydrogenase [Ilumatobacteraceae bacterium]
MAKANSAPQGHLPTVRIGVVGHGVVGSAFTALVARQRDVIAARTGVQLEVTRIAVSDAGKHPTRVGTADVVTDALAVAAAADVDLVVEVMGGTTLAGEVIRTALESGKPVVTANKALLAARSAELFKIADERGIDLLFEAAVCGGIPLIRPLRESLRGEPIRRVLGIVNGTTNYILTKMTESGSDYSDALREAQQLGYAESDPTADVEGHDAAAKIAIIANFAFGVHVVADDVSAEGISRISASDIAMAQKFGYVIKLLGVAERDSDTGAVSVRVHPAMVGLKHPLASVREAFNAVLVEGEASGSLMFYGRGAGGDPTASSVLGDVIDAAVNLRKGTHATLGTFSKATFTSPGEVVSEFMLTLEVADKPGVLHAVTGVFARNKVSIRAAEQDGIGSDARLVFVTHDARTSDVQKCLDEFQRLDVVSKVGGVIRIIGA